MKDAQIAATRTQKYIKQLADKAATEATKRKIEWGSQIRNYLCITYKLVKDIRTDVNIDTRCWCLILVHFIKAYLMEESKTDMLKDLVQIYMQHLRKALAVSDEE